MTSKTSPGSLFHLLEVAAPPPALYLQASTDRVQVKEVQAKSILTPQKMGSLSAGFDFSINPYAGCAFACAYCYVPKFPSSKHEPQDWGTWVEAKVNAAELIRNERARVFGSRIFFSSATDPYQYIELKYRLSRACLSELLKYKPKRLILHTRSHLILQDLALLKEFGDVLEVGVSITSDDEQVVREFEPNAPALKRRLALVKALHDNQVRVFASLAPLLPHDPSRLAGALAPYVSRVWMDQLRWPEVSTNKALLDKYRDYFAPDNYQKALFALRQALVKQGVSVRP